MSWKLCDDYKEIEVRKVYGKTLEELIKKDKKVVVADADLAGSSGAGYLFDKYKDNCVNFGIAEQNMISACSAMSLTGIIPYVHSFSPFVSRRVVDQIAVSLGFSKSNLHIYASEPGYWSLFNGATHTTFCDIAIMRAIPGMTVVAPSDAVSFKWVLEYYYQNKGAFYNRCTRKAIPQIYETDSTFEYGKSQVLKKGKDVALISIGASVYDCLEARKELLKFGIDCTVIDLLFIKPLDKELILNTIRENRLIVTVENHSKYGGIGELIGGEIAKSVYHTDLKMIAVDDIYGEVGTKDYLKERFGLTKEVIINTVKKYFA